MNQGDNLIAFRTGKYLVETIETTISMLIENPVKTRLHFVPVADNEKFPDDSWLRGQSHEAAEIQLNYDVCIRINAADIRKR